MHNTSTCQVDKQQQWKTTAGFNPVSQEQDSEALLKPEGLTLEQEHITLCK